MQKDEVVQVAQFEGQELQTLLYSAKPEEQLVQVDPSEHIAQFEMQLRQDEPVK